MPPQTSSQASHQQLNVSDLALRCDRKRDGSMETDRALLIGATRYGKSTLAKFLIEQFSEMYCRKGTSKSKLSGRVLVIDTKPRWRATRVATGPSIQRRYRRFVKGDTLDGAVVLDRGRDWDLAWHPDINPSGVVVAQRLDMESGSPQLVAWMVAVMRKFFDTQDPSQPSLLYVDEGMDFFGPSGNALHGNAIQRCFRGGGERGMSCLLGLQRPKTVSLQVLTESNILYLFHLRYEEDVKRLHEMGFPRDQQSPRSKYTFLYFRDDELYPKPLRLQLKG